MWHRWISQFHTYFACKIHVNHMRIFMILTCETWFPTLFPYFAYFHMWKQIFFTCVSHVYCMQFTCEILHPFTCEKWSLHVMGHISHENVSWSHVNRMWKTGVRMRKIRMRKACEILTRTDGTAFAQGHYLEALLAITNAVQIRVKADTFRNWFLPCLLPKRQQGLLHVKWMSNICQGPFGDNSS